MNLEDFLSNPVCDRDGVWWRHGSFCVPETQGPVPEYDFGWWQWPEAPWHIRIELCRELTTFFERDVARPLPAIRPRSCPVEGLVCPAALGNVCRFLSAAAAMCKEQERFRLLHSWGLRQSQW